MLTDDSTAPLILVVEDDYNHAELIQRSFEDTQDRYRLEIVGTLFDAWKVIERQTPDLVLADYRLPDGDGNELVVMVNDVCPVILMTSQGSEQVAVTSIKMGVQDYIVKSPDVFSSMPRIVKMALREWDLIQERRRIYEAVSRGKRDWERTFDAVPDLISIIDLNHTITRVNRAMAERFGLTPEDIIGRKCYEVVHHYENSPDCCPVAGMLQDGLIHKTEIEEKRINCVFDVTVSPLYDDEGNITACVHVARDITERKQAEEERQHIEQQFQQTQKLESLGVLAGGIAHDFNNILTIILGHCYIVDQNIDSDIDQKNHVKQIERAAGRAADLCRQMLSYAGKNPMVQTGVNLWLMVDETVKMLQSGIKKNVGIKLDLKCDVPIITGDSAQIQQVVMNLIINAAEAIGDKNGTINIELKKTTLPEGQEHTDFLGNAIQAGNYAFLTVSDNGCGMDVETQQRIFEPFYTTKFAGRGLGMSAILGILKSHNASLQLSSKLGVGTVFKVFFPLPPAHEIVETTPIASVFSAEKGRGSILLADDEESLRIIGSSLLKAMGFSALTAANGREALELYRKQGSGIDLILLDMIMPEMGGIETYRQLREISPSIPIVVCSGYSLEEVMEAFGDDQLAAVIQKPYNPDQLRNTLMKLLDKKEWTSQ